MAYKLTHPDSDQVIEREAEDVANYVSQGWQTKSGVKAPPAPAGPVVTDVTPEK